MADIATNLRHEPFNASWSQSAAVPIVRRLATRRPMSLARPNPHTIPYPDPNRAMAFPGCRYEDCGRVRPVLHRMSLVEMCVPYADPNPPYQRKCAFDVRPACMQAVPRLQQC